MAVSIKNSQIEVDSWYQKITLALTNDNNRAGDMRYAVIGFIGAGRQKLWGNLSGMLKGDARIGSDLNTIASGPLNTVVNSATNGVVTVGDFYAGIMATTGDKCRHGNCLITGFCHCSEAVGRG